MTRHLLLLLTALSLASCVGPGAVGKFLREEPLEAEPLVKHYLDENESVAAAYFARHYKPQVRLIPGHFVERTDTVRTPGVVLPCPPPTPENPRPSVQCPDQETITRERSKTDTLEVPNLARERELELELAMKNLEIHDLNGEKKHLQGRVSKQGKTILHLSLLYVGTLFVFGAILYFLIRR